MTKCHFLQAILKLGGKVESEVTSKTTHVVSPNEERTMNILRGVIRACLIVNINWIHDSMAKDKWMDTTLYQHNICDSRRVSLSILVASSITYDNIFSKVHERSILGSKIYKNLAFAIHGPFYLNKETIENARKIDYLKEIIQLCGGVLAEIQSEASVIVSDQPAESDQTVVISTFIFDSAMKGTFLEPTSYRPRSKKN
jgi:BRCT domain, a BRCA1 C-terminus domain/BRCA1 C Terminus (BRCT) domain